MHCQQRNSPPHFALRIATMLWRGNYIKRLAVLFPRDSFCLVSACRTSSPRAAYDPCAVYLNVILQNVTSTRRSDQHRRFAASSTEGTAGPAGSSIVQFPLAQTGEGVPHSNELLSCKFINLCLIIFGDAQLTREEGPRLPR